MKTIKEIQEYNRKKIICAVHNTDDYEEALEKECSPLAKALRGQIPRELMIDFKNTLNRVLLALENSFEGEDGCFGLNFHHGLFDSWWITLSKSGAGIIETWICKCDLTKETLEEQSEETQRAVYKLLGGDV